MLSEEKEGEKQEAAEKGVSKDEISAGEEHQPDSMRWSGVWLAQQSCVTLCKGVGYLSTRHGQLLASGCPQEA